MKPRVYDRNMNMLGALDNAASVSYSKKLNDLHSARFKLPILDKGVELCYIRNIVDIFDGNISVGKYRIIGAPEANITSKDSMLEVSCEHVIAFLMDDVIDGKVSYGPDQTIKYTPDIINDILSRQTVLRWQLGVCEYNSADYSYNFENTNLLDALFNIPKSISNLYHWTYDTSTYPWTINLLNRSNNTSPECGIERGSNLIEIRRSIDISTYCNRLYCKGSDNDGQQVTITSVNDGLPYIEDAAHIARWGLVAGHYIDKSESDPNMLLAKGRIALIESTSTMRYKYNVIVLDMYRKTGDNWYLLDEGKTVHLNDAQNMINNNYLITEIRKNDVDGNPMYLEVSLDNFSSSTASLSIENLMYKIAHGIV